MGFWDDTVSKIKSNFKQTKEAVGLAEDIYKGLTGHGDTKVTLKPSDEPAIVKDYYDSAVVDDPKTTTKYRVNTMNGGTKLGANSEVFKISDGYTGKAVTPYNVTTFGRSKLDGVQDYDKLVVYDPDSKQLYRWDQDTEASAKVKETRDYYSGLMDSTETEYSAKLEDYEARLLLIQDTLKKATDSETFNAAAKYYDEVEAEYQTTYEQYTGTTAALDAERSKYADKYNEFGIYEMNSDFKNQMDELVMQMDTAEQEYNSGQKRIEKLQDYNNPDYINSFKDVFAMVNSDTKNIRDGLDSNGVSDPLSYAISGGLANVQGFKYIGDLFNNVVAEPFRLNSEGKMTNGGTAKTLFMSTLNNVGETFDLATGAGFVKATIIPMVQYAIDTDMSDMELSAMLQEAKKGLGKYDGSSGEGSTQYDWFQVIDTGNKAIDFVLSFSLELMSDPTNWFTKAAKLGVMGGKFSKGFARADLAQAYRLTGAADEAAEVLAKRAAKRFYKGSSSLEDSFIKAGSTTTIFNRATDKVYDALHSTSTQSQVRRSVSDIIKATGDNKAAIIEVAKNIPDSVKKYKLVSTLKNSSDSIHAMQRYVFDLSTFGASRIPSGLYHVLKSVKNNPDVYSVYETLLNRVRGKIWDDQGNLKVIGADIDMVRSTINDELDDVFAALETPAVRIHGAEILGALVNDLVKTDLSNILSRIRTGAQNELPDLNEFITQMTKGRYDNAYDYIKAISGSEAMSVMSNEVKQLLRTTANKIGKIDAESNAQMVALSLDLINGHKLALRNISQEIWDISDLGSVHTDTINEWYSQVRQLSSIAADPALYKLDAARVAIIDIKAKSILNNFKNFVDTKVAGATGEYIDVMPDLLVLRKEIDDLVSTIKASVTQLQDVTDTMRINAGRSVVFTEAPKNSKNSIINNAEKDIKDTIKMYINNNFDADISDEALAKCVVNSMDGVDVTDTARVYTGMFSKQAGLSQLASNDELRKAVAVITDNNTISNAYLNSAMDVLEDPEAASILRLASSLRVQSEMFDAVWNSPDLGGIIKNGVVDAMSGSEAVVNDIINGLSINNKTIEEVSSDITDIFVKDSSKYLNSRAGKDSKLFSNVMEDGTHVNFNTPDGTLNVQNMLAYSTDRYFKSAYEGLAEQAEQYRDIYFSVTKVTDKGFPASITFGTLDIVDGVPVQNIKTFTNDIAFTVTGKNASDYFGMSTDTAVTHWNNMIARDGVVNPEEFMAQVSEHLDMLSRTTGHQTKSMRYVGFNNSVNGVGTDAVLSKYYAKSELHAYNKGAFDMADSVRLTNGSAVYTDTDYKSLYSIVENAVTTATNNNTAGTFNLKSSVLGHPTSSQVNVLDKFINRIQNGNDIIAKNLSAEVQGGLIIELKQLRESFLTAKDAVDKLAGNFNTAFILEDKLLQAVRDLGIDCPEHINIMKAFSSGIPLDKGLMFNPLNKINNIRNSSWFDMDKLREIAGDSRAYEHATEVTIRLERRFNQISNFALVSEYSLDTYKSVKNSILDMFTPQQYEDYFSLQVCNLALKGDLTQMQYYAVLRDMVSHVPVELQSALIDTIKKAGDTDSLDLASLVCIFDPAHVSRTSPFYAQPGMSALANRIAEPTSDLMLYNTLTKADEASSKFFANVELELLFRRQFLEANGAFKPEEDISMQIMTKLTSKMQSTMDRWNNARKVIDDSYLRNMDATATPMEKAGAYELYSSHVREFNNKRSAFNGSVRSAEFETVTKMSGPVLEAHLVRNCFNVMLLDPTDAMFKNKHNAKLLAKFMGKVDGTRIIKTKLEDGTYWIHTANVPDAADTVARNAYFAEMNKIARQDIAVNFDVESHLPKYPVKGGEPTYYGLHLQTNEIIKSMQDYLPPSFFLSDFTAVTQEYYTTLLSKVPGAEFATVSELEKMGWFDDSFACSIIGGQGNMLKDAYSYSSQDYLSNIFTGLNHTKKNLEYVQDQFNIYNVKQNSLRYTFDNTLDANKDNWKMWKDALANNDMVLSKPLYLKDSKNLDTAISVKIQEYTITDDKSFRKYLSDPNIMITDNSTLGTLRSYATGKNRDWKIDRAVNRGTSVLDRTKALGSSIEQFEKQMRGVRMVGWLFTKPATWINNAVAAGISSVLQTNDIAYIRMLRNSVESVKRCEDIFKGIHASNNTVNSVNIHNYFKTNPSAGISEDFFKLYYGVKSHSSGGLVGTISKMVQDNTWGKLATQIKDNSGIVLKGEDLSVALDKKFNSVYRLGKGQSEYDYVTLNKQLSDIIDNAGYTPEVAAEIKKVALNYTPKAKNLSDMFFKVPVLGAYMDKNRELFSNVETYVRTSIAQYYMEELGLTFSEAMHKSTISQFDYSNKGRILTAMDTVIPFSTFKVYNTWYWMTEALAQPAAIRAIHSYANTYSVDDIQDASYRMYMTAKYANMTQQDDEDLVPENVDSYKGAIIDYAKGEGYQGTGKLYGSQAGWIPMDDSHSLKLSNGFMEAGNMISNVIMGLSSFDGAKTFLQDQIYSPYVTAMQTFTSILDGNEAANFSENVYDAIDFVPFLGTLTNNVIASVRNWNAKKADITSMTLTNGLLGHEYARSIYEAALDMISVAVPSILSVDSNKLSYINRPVGYDWYNQDDEYKSTHKFVLGVSAVPTWVYKDPAHYVDHLGMYLKLGYSKDEALEILNKGYIFDEDGNMVKYDRYEDSALPNLFKYNNEVFDNTLNYLLDRGYSLDESYALICEGGIWVDEDGNKKSNTDLKQLLNESVVADGYKMIPDYIKYEDGQYAKQKAYYKDQGLSIMQAKAMMSTTSIYIDASGSANPLNEMEVEQRNLAVQVAYEEFTSSLPNYLRYEDGAVSRTLSSVEELFGLSTAQAKQYIIDHNSYVDTNGEYHEYSAEEEQELNDKNEYDYYIKSAELPSYIRYEAGAISRTRSYLMGYGYSADEAWEQMANGFYVDPNGNAKDYSEQPGSNQYRTEDQVYNFVNSKKTTAKKSSKGKTPYVKTGKVASKFSVPKYSANNYVGPTGVSTNGRTYGMSQVYKHTTTGIGERLKSAYPAAYRNVIYGHKRTLYDDLYLNGIPKKSYILNYRGYANTSLMRTRIKYNAGRL